MRSRQPTTQSKARGGALLLALVIITVLTMLIGGTLVYVQQHSNLDWADARSEAALLVAEAGINDEMQYIARNTGNSSITALSSQPTVQGGETLVSPFTNAIVLGRKGTVDGMADGNFWVYATTTPPSSGGTPAAWDGKTTPFYIVATGYVYGSWRRVSVKTGTISVFDLDAIFALAAYQNNSNAIGLQNATVTVNGRACTNGQVSNSSSTLVASNLLNANTTSNPTGQFTSDNLATGGILATQVTPVIYPTVTSVLYRETGKSWNDLIAGNSNASGVYTYKSSASSDTISTTNCVSISPTFNNMLSNTSTGSYTDAWGTAAYKPNTGASNFIITGATNSSPITITTSKRHRLTTGDSVTITGVAGNTAANGTWTVTVPNGGSGNTTFTLNSSTGNGTYTSGGSGVKNITISSATRSGSSNITVTTTANHNLSTGDSVTITGNSLANGTWIITVPNGVTGKTAFTLNNSTGAAGTVSGGSVRLNAVKTLIFEPGDYYFSTVNVISDPFTEIVIDSQAYASGGSPGQVRFWIRNPSGENTVQNDAIRIPIKATKASGATTADPSLFRIYYGQDKGVFTFERPVAYTNYDGSAAGDFNVYGAVYAVTKQPGDTSSLSGTEIDFIGQGGSITLNGALIADKVTFHYICTVNFISMTGNSNDPVGAAGALGGYSDG